MEKKLYEKPSLEVVKIECSVIASSPDSDLKIDLPGGGGDGNGSGKGNPEDEID